MSQEPGKVDEGISTHYAQLRETTLGYLALHCAHLR